MSAARNLTHFVALVSLAAGLAGCGEVGYRGAVPPAHTQSFRTEPASPLPAGVDAMIGLQQRPMRPPTLAADETCSASSATDLGAVAPNYGAGVGPAYMSGQDSWYSGGQVTILMVDSQYSGPLLVRAFQLGGNGKSTVTLAVLPSPGSGTAYKERQHGWQWFRHSTRREAACIWARWPRLPSGEPGSGGSPPTALDALGSRWTETCSPSSSCSRSTQEHRHPAEPRLTDRCAPFHKWRSAFAQCAKRRCLPAFIAGVAVRRAR